MTDWVQEFLEYEDDRVTIFEPVLMLQKENIHFGAGVRIDSFVDIRGGLGVWIGKCVHIANHASINIGGGYVVIGDYAAVAAGARIIGASSRPEGQSMSAAAPAEMQVVEKCNTKLGAYSAVLVNAVVLPGVTLGEGAILAAGGVATKDIPAWEVWGGVPAKKIGDRESR